MPGKKNDEIAVKFLVKIVKVYQPGIGLMNDQLMLFDWIGAIRAWLCQ